VITYIIIALISYFLGNISTSYIVGRKVANVDIRTQGSGNAGATNVLRTLGKKAAAIAFIGDILKGSIAVVIGRYLAGRYGLQPLDGAYVGAVFVVLGHNWPALLGFRGGKGVATSLGTMLAIYPIYALICLAISILIMYRSKYVSLGSILGITCFPVAMVIIGNNKAAIVGFILTAIALYTHRENIKRLKNGTERKLGEKKNISK
jgi:glycerol-3-phosphate acyltransferase PlsY